MGLDLAAGRVESAVADPEKGHTAYAAGNDGGVWKTTGWTSDPPYWTPLGDTQAYVGPGDPVEGVLVTLESEGGRVPSPRR